MVYEPLYHALQYGNCTRLLKIKNKLKIGCFYKYSQEEFSILRAWLGIYHLISNAHSWNNC